jgi:hypothetical protein
MGAEVAAPDEPLVVLLDHRRSGEANEGAVVGEDVDDVGAAADLAVDPLERVRGSELRPVVGGKGGRRAASRPPARPTTSARSERRRGSRRRSRACLRDRQLDLAGPRRPRPSPVNRCDAPAAPPAPAHRARRRPAPTLRPPSAAGKPSSRTRAGSRDLRPRAGSRPPPSAVILFLSAIVLLP